MPLNKKSNSNDSHSQAVKQVKVNCNGQLVLYGVDNV